MKLPLTDHKAQVITESLKTLDFLKEELGVPPIFTCLIQARFALENLLSYYEKNNLEVPPSLKNIIKDLPAITEQLGDSIENQYTYLNAEGSA